MINDENRSSYQALFFAIVIVGFILLGFYLTVALAIYIALVFLVVILVFTIPPLFWLLLISAATYGGYYIHHHIHPLL